MEKLARDAYWVRVTYEARMESAKREGRVSRVDRYRRPGRMTADEFHAAMCEPAPNPARYREILERS